jgi:hypothetical protein
MDMNCMYEHDSAEYAQTRRLSREQNPTLQFLPLTLLDDSHHVCFWYDAQPGDKPRLTIIESFACFLCRASIAQGLVLSFVLLMAHGLREIV